MSPEAQLALVNLLPQILTIIITAVGTGLTALVLKATQHNKKAIEETGTAVNANINDNTLKTEDVGKAVNGRMTAFINEMKEANRKEMAEAIKAARLDAEKIALSSITELKVQIALARSDKEILAALQTVESKLINAVTAIPTSSSGIQVAPHIPEG